MALTVAISMFCDAMPCYADEDEVGCSTKLFENMEYSCTFDMDKLRFCFVETVLNSSGKVIKQKKTYTDAVITKNGGLDAYIRLGGNTYV